MKIKKIVFNTFSENTFIVWDENSGQGIIIDPGCSTKDEEEKLTKFITKNNITPKYLINTHCHIDHILGNAFVKDKYNIRFLAPEEDLFLLSLMVQQAASFGFEMKESPNPDTLLKEGLKLEFPSEINFLFTPGHTPGEFCLYFPEAKFCLTGDVLFKDGIGRTDLWGGSYDTLINSIETKLFTLPDETTIYPGHGEESSIGYEKKNNPFLV